MQIRLALCDDDRRALPIIAGAVESTFAAHGVQTNARLFFSAEELLAAMADTRFDLLLLDIAMPGMDGIALGKQIRAEGNDIKIIYVSESEERVFESFLVQPLGFVRKSNFLNDISAIIELFLSTADREKRGEYLNFRTRTGILTLKSRQVTVIEGNRNYQYLYVEGRRDPIEIKMTMDQLEEITKPCRFLRIHKGYLVNCRCISHLSSAEVTLQNGMRLPVGRSKALEVKRKYLMLMRN